jgi:hypothetical protein
MGRTRNVVWTGTGRHQGERKELARYKKNVKKQEIGDFSSIEMYKSETVLEKEEEEEEEDDDDEGGRKEGGGEEEGGEKG